MKIIEYTKNNDLAEIYQKSTSVFALLKQLKEKNTYQQCTQFVKCRDFLNDVVRSILTNKPIKIYGFAYNPETDPLISMDYIGLLIKDPNKEILPTVEKAITILNYYETLLKVSKEDYSYFKKVDNNTCIVFGPKVWLSSQVLMSLYTLTFRIAELNINVDKDNVQNLKQVYKTFLDNYKGNVEGDVKYLRSIYENVEDVLLHYKEVLDLKDNKYDPIYTDGKITLHSFHNYSGIVTLLETYNDNYVYKNRKADLKKIIEKAKESKKAPVQEENLISINNAAKDIHNIYTTAGYNQHKIAFAFVTTRGNKRFVCHTPVTCREHLLAAYRSLAFNEKDITVPFPTETVKGETFVFPVETKKLRLLCTISGIGTDNNRTLYHKRELFFAKKVLNYYEKRAGFKPSMISTVLYNAFGKSHSAWLFTGDGVWLSSPVLLTLYPLIIRMAKQYVYHLYKLNRLDELPEIVNEEAFEKMLDLLYKDIYVDTPKHEKHLVIYKNRVNFILKNAKNLFKDVQEKAFFVDKNILKLKKLSVNNINCHCNLGINSFLTERHIDTSLTKSFKQLEKTQK